MSSIKELAESGELTSIPSNYVFSQYETVHLSDPVPTEELPIIDFSLLVNGNPDQRSQIVQYLGQTCREWGFFMVVNHGVEERLRDRMLEVCQDFFDSSDSEKGKYVGKHVLDPIRCGTSFNSSVEKIFCWRDFIKILVHPIFHSPQKPVEFRDISKEYCARIRELVRELLAGVSESLGLERWYLEKATEWENSFQILIANYYPQCPQPELAMGMAPHSDHGLLTVLMQNDIHVGGLQVKHNGRWVPVNPLPNSLIINIGDQLEILSNGKYKSVEHRAVVNDQRARMSVAIGNGPCLDKAVIPAPQLVDAQHPSAYREMTYREYMEVQHSKPLDGKSCLDLLRVQSNV